MGVDLVVPIDFVDCGCYTATGGFRQARFLKCGFFINTADYDGDVTYYLEYVIGNDSDRDCTWLLTDYTGVHGPDNGIDWTKEYASITAPANSGTAIYRVAFTPDPGEHSYMPVDYTGYSVPVEWASTLYAGRVVVVQIGATKTKIWRPLYNGNIGGQDSHQQVNYVPDAGGPSGGDGVFIYDSTKWEADSVSWEMEIVCGGSSGGCDINHALYDITAGQYDAGTYLVVPAGSFWGHNTYATLEKWPIYPTFVEGHMYQHRSSIADQWGVPGPGKLYRICLYQKLEGLVRCETSWRVSRQAGLYDMQVDGQRINPTFYLGGGEYINYAKTEVSTKGYTGSGTDYHEIIDGDTLGGASHSGRPEITSARATISDVAATDYAVGFSADWQEQLRGSYGPDLSYKHVIVSGENDVRWVLVNIGYGPVVVPPIELDWGPGCIFSFAPGWTSGCTFSFNAPGSGIGALQGCIPDSECQPAATVELADMPRARIKCTNRARKARL